MLPSLVIAAAALLFAGTTGAQTSGPDRTRTVSGSAPFVPGSMSPALAVPRNRAAGVQAQSVALDPIFDFDTGTPALSAGQSIPFDQTSGGVTAHFSVPSSFGFSLQSGLTEPWVLSQFSGNYLAPSSVNSGFLAIKFSHPLTSINFEFATSDIGQVEVPTTILLTAYMDSDTTAPVGTATAHGTFNLTDTFPMGKLSFDGAGHTFNLIEISIPHTSTAASSFLVDNIAVTTAPLAFSNRPAASQVSGASLAADSLVVALGPGLASASQAAFSMPPPATLALTTVSVQDSLGAVRQAPLYYVSPTQIDYVVPDGTATGAATVTVSSNGQITATGGVTIDTVAPGVFTANGDGKGVPAAQAITIAPDGTQATTPVALCGATTGSCVPAPIDLGATGTQVVLALFGTGIRGFSSLAAVSATIGGASAQVQSAGAVPQYSGLDEVKIVIPRTLAGLGALDLILTVDGKAANTVQITIK